MGRYALVHPTMPGTATDWRPTATPSTDSSGACPDDVGSAYWHAVAIHTTVSHYELDQPVISIIALISV